MDAEGTCDERDQGGRRRRVVLAPLGWCQAYEVMISQATVTRRSWTPGRARRKPLKPSRREGRMFSVEPVVTAACFFLLQAGRGCQPAPGLPCALLDFGGTRLPHHPGISGRGDA